MWHTYTILDETMQNYLNASSFVNLISLSCEYLRDRRIKIYYLKHLEKIFHTQKNSPRELSMKNDHDSRSNFLQKC